MTETATAGTTGGARARLLPCHAVAAFVVSRAAVVVGSVLAHLSRSRVSVEGNRHIAEGPWTWDGSWYVQLAKSGWQATGREAYRFFPVYPIIGRVGGGQARWVLLISTNVATLLALAVLWHWIARSTTTGMADRSMWAVALFPAALALTWAYSEGLFLLCTAVFLWAVYPPKSADPQHHSRGWVATVAGMAAGIVAGATRPTGITLAIVPVVLIVSEWNRRRATLTLRPTESADRGEYDDELRSLASLFAMAVAPFVGFGATLLWVRAAAGSLLIPVRVQSELRAGPHEPVTRVLMMIRDVATGHGADLWNLGFVILAIGSLVAAWRYLDWAMRTHGLATLVIALSANNVNSLGRYVLMAPSLVLGWAAIGPRMGTDRGRRLVDGGLLAAGVAGTIVFTWLSATGVVVP